MINACILNNFSGRINVCLNLYKLIPFIKEFMSVLINCDIRG